MFKVIIAGSRDFSDYPMLAGWIGRYEELNIMDRYTVRNFDDHEIRGSM